MAKLHIKPHNKTLDVPSHKNILEALREEGLYIKSSCGGVASCSDCIIKIIHGQDNLSSPPFEEINLLGNVFHITKERLACQLKIDSDVTIDISHHDKEKDQSRMRQKTGQLQSKRTLIRKNNSEEKETTNPQNRGEKKSDRDKSFQENSKTGGFNRPKSKFKKS